jgi:hypothetical protein
MKKEIKNGQGFVCKDLNEKKRIWERLTEAGYPMYCSYNDCDKDYPHIAFSMDKSGGIFGGGFFENITEPLNEDELFGENEWTPKAGEWVDVSDNRQFWAKRQYLATVNNQYICVVEEGKINGSSAFNTWLHIRQIPPIPEMTIAEAEQKFKIKIKQP